MKAFLKKYATWVLCVIILAAALIVYTVQSMAEKNTAEVTVYVDGLENGTYSLFENQEILITTPNGTNLLIIENATAYVKEANCKSQVCVHTQPITSDGGQIICLPHKVVIYAGMQKEEQIDAVTN